MVNTCLEDAPAENLNSDPQKPNISGRSEAELGLGTIGPCARAKQAQEVHERKNQSDIKKKKEAQT